MKKVALSINETLKYQRSMVIEIPDELSDEKLDALLDNAEREAEAPGDIPLLLGKIAPDIKILESPDESDESPYDTEIEIDDLHIVEE
ncbi:hypothetical protein G3M81_12425 [Bacillus paralicheniformis]|uniref:hypothetical protein n=1 Tax=Bacillus TaxID=1386 RepID=UPI0013EF08AE|nr:MULTISPECIES: hypothetical protein [Bacillus]MCY8609908.1 hypothetical protein [Bacillus haynesii]MEC0752143.1 hypothetical protein [Bacillus haynesii]QII49495.1 hypothetical protein G3M81_12425 [Bacillus paralicheniformis]